MRMIRKFEKDESNLRELFTDISEATSRRYGKYIDIPVNDIVSNIINDKNEISMTISNGERIIGYAHLNIFDKHSRRFQAAVGIIIHDDFQGMGVGAFALGNIIDHAVDLGLKKLWVHIHEDNIPSLSIFKKFYFEVEGTFKDDEWFDDKEPTTVLSLARFII